MVKNSTTLDHGRVEVPLLSEAVYQKVIADLTDMGPGKRLMPEKSLAARYNVSLSTLRRITDRLQSEGYLIKQRGRGTFTGGLISGHQGSLLTILFADLWERPQTPFYTHVFRGAMDEACKRNFRLQVLRCEKLEMNGKLQPGLIQAVGQADVRGLIMPWLHPRLVHELKIIKPELRLISSSNRYPLPGCTSICIDYPAVGYAAFSLLNSRGVKRPMLIHLNKDTVHGWRNAAADAMQAESEICSYCYEISNPLEPGKALQMLREFASDGIAFDDDYVLGRVYPLLTESDSWFNRSKICSFVQAGENLPDHQIMRIEIDGYIIGCRMVHEIERTINCSGNVCEYIAIQPTGSDIASIGGT